MATIGINFFSYSSLTFDGQTVKIPFAKAEGLLYCLINNKRMSKESLCHLLWGDCSEEMAKKSLRNAIYILRKLFGEDLIVAETQSLLALGERFQIDSDLAFLAPERLPGDIAAIADFIDFYQQDFLSHFVIKNALEFTEWVYFEQEKYRRLYLERLEQMATLAESSAEVELAKKCLYKLISCEQFEERYYLRLVRLLVAQNKLPEAIKVYSKLETLFKDELLIQPSAELSELIGAAIKEHLIIGGRGEYFYGRETELAELKQNFVSFTKGDPFSSYVFIGEAGIGKTSLLYKFTDNLQNDFIVFDICNYLIDKDFTYKMWEDIFQQICYCVEQKRLTIPKWQLQSIQNVSAQFSLVDRNIDEGGEAPLARLLIQLMETITRQQKVFLVIDDLQWVDDSSIDLLLKVLLRCKNLMLVATMLENRPQNLQRLLYGLKNKHTLRQIRLDRFSQQETQALVRRLAPELSHHSDLIYRESEGIPFFITEMVSNYRAGVDIRVLNQHMKDFIGARINMLDHAEQAVINICAVINGDIKMELLSATCGMGDVELLEILEVLMRRQIINEFLNGQGELNYSFAHPKIREFVYNNISLSKRGILHEKIADAMAALYGNDKRRQTYYPRLIYHYTVAGNIYKVLKYRLTHLETQVKLQNEMFPVCLNVEESGISSYHSPDKDLKAELDELAQLFDDPKLNCDEGQLAELQIRYYYLQGRYYHSHGDRDNGEQMMQKMFTLAMSANEEVLIADAYIRMILQSLDNYDLPRILQYANEAEKLPYVHNNAEYLTTIIHYKGYAYILQGNYQQGEALIKQNVALLESLPDYRGYGHILAADYFCLGESRLHQGDADAAEHYLFTARAYCHDNRVNSSRAIINLGLGVVKYLRKEYGAAAQVLSISRESYQRNGFLWCRVTLFCYLALTSLKLGDLEQARDYAQKCLRIPHVPANSLESRLIDKMRQELAEAGVELEND